MATDPTSGDLTVTVDQVQRGATYFVRVEAAQKDVFGIGAYRLTAGQAGFSGLPGFGRFTLPVGLGELGGMVPLSPSTSWALIRSTNVRAASRGVMG